MVKFVLFVVGRLSATPAQCTIYTRTYGGKVRPFIVRINNRVSRSIFFAFLPRTELVANRPRAEDTFDTAVQLTAAQHQVRPAVTA